MPSMTLPASAAAAPKQKKLSFGEMFRTADGRSQLFVFVLVSTLFGLWGFCNGQLDILNKHFQAALGLTKAQSALVQFANFMGYFVMAIPAGMLAKRFGYKGGILIGLVLIAAGAYWFIPATRIGTYGAFLTGLFVLAAGLACLETVANPYTTVLGPPEAAAARINLAQTCNGLGVLLGPVVGGSLIRMSTTSEANRSNEHLYVPYLLIGAVVTVLALIFAFSKVPDIEQRTEASTAASSSGLWSRRHFSFAVVAQFFYVGAQIAVWAFFINYIKEETPLMGSGLAHLFPAEWTFPKGAGYQITDFGATRFFSFGGFGLFLVGRFIGSMVLRTSSPHRVLALYGIINSVLTVVIMMGLGWVSVAALLGSFFFMSIMFPTIFSLGIDGLGEHTKKASAYIVMAIVGGALLPFPTGWIADKFSMSIGFVVPLVCFAIVAAYGALWERLRYARP
jgi:MFS transporter, FHS family, L-fucose permease